MPNHCENKLTVYGPEEDVAKFELKAGKYELRVEVRLHLTVFNVDVKQEEGYETYGEHVDLDIPVEVFTRLLAQRGGD